ncbi:major facilitator superfamily domain-containing protein [Aspergillus karnatakaensis]|uniref:MFS transporter n=1 Tax=Aspergillus karnatakaensis TaxID=1810916 RepID=UPI003CCE17FD
MVLEAGSPTGHPWYVVWWDSPDDPENPYNWQTWKKVLNCGAISAMTFITPLGYLSSAVFAAGAPSAMLEFYSHSLTIASFVVSIYGRVVVYHFCNIGFVAFAIGSAVAPTLNGLIVIRFCSGASGCAAVTNGGGSITDMVAQEHRGKALAAYSIGPLLGPIIGPVAGGFITDAAGWRWNFWLLAIAGSVLAILMGFVLSETYAPVVLKQKDARLRRQTGNPLLRSKLDSGRTPQDHFKRSIIRPTKMLFRSPIVAIASVYVAISYGYLYLMFTTIPTVFQETYGFTTGTAGLAYLGLGIGSIVEIAYTSITSDKVIRRNAAGVARNRNHESRFDIHCNIEPEHRLLTLPIGSILIPLSLFVYGWMAEYKIHWIVAVISHVPIGIGNMVIFMCIQMYLVDGFTVYAASAIATNTVVRSIAGALLPMAGLPLFENLGLGWGNSLLGFIAIGTIPISLAIMRWGEYLRRRFEIPNL